MLHFQEHRGKVRGALLEHHHLATWTVPESGIIVALSVMSRLWFSILHLQKLHLAHALRLRFPRAHRSACLPEADAHVYLQLWSWAADARRYVC